MEHHEASYDKLKVYLENVAINIQHLINIHFSDMMAIFYKVFKGFKLLHQEFGSFTPDPRMIGFNEKAEVKVWANVKYSKSRPQASYQMMDEENMVHALIEIFNSKVDIGSIPIDSHKNPFKF